MSNLSLAVSVATPKDERWVTARKYARPAIVRTSVGERFSLGPLRCRSCSSDGWLSSLQARQQSHQRQVLLSLEA